MPSIPTWPLSKQEKYTLVYLVAWPLYRTVKLGVEERGQDEWGRQYYFKFSLQMECL